jgi:hypothetical protein
MCARARGAARRRRLAQHTAQTHARRSQPHVRLPAARAAPASPPCTRTHAHAQPATHPAPCTAAAATRAGCPPCFPRPQTPGACPWSRWTRHCVALVWLWGACMCGGALGCVWPCGRVALLPHSGASAQRPSPLAAPRARPARPPQAHTWRGCRARAARCTWRWPSSPPGRGGPAGRATEPGGGGDKQHAPRQLAAASTSAPAALPA